jgi:hypothetical protein
MGLSKFDRMIWGRFMRLIFVNPLQIKMDLITRISYV